MANLDAFKENQEVKEIDMSKKVKVGIIGTGWIADAHINGYINMLLAEELKKNPE